LSSAQLAAIATTHDEPSSPTSRLLQCNRRAASPARPVARAMNDDFIYRQMTPAGHVYFSLPADIPASSMLLRASRFVLGRFSRVLGRTYKNVYHYAPAPTGRGY